MNKLKGFGETYYIFWLVFAFIIVAFHAYDVFNNSLGFNPLVFVSAIIFIILAYVFKTSKSLNHQPIIRIKNESALASIAFNAAILSGGPLFFRWLVYPYKTDPYIDNRFPLAIAVLSVVATVVLIVKSLKDKQVQ